MMKHKFLFLTLICLIICNLYITSQTQNTLVKQRESSLIYIYKISDSEAEHLLLKTPKAIEQQYFHSLIDVCNNTQRNAHKNLEAGHYLFVKTVENKQVANYEFVPAFDVLTFNNNTDLSVQVLDLEGNLVKNAEVRVKSARLKFDAKTECYTDKKSYKKGLLSVKYNGLTAYYQLDRENNYTSFKRGMNFVLYRTPLNLVSIPIHKIIHLRDTWWQLKYHFRQTGNAFQRLFDGEFDNDNLNDRYTGYFVFNKPKYLPKDTVKFKAFIVKKSNGKPLDKPVKVILKDDKYKNRLNAIINPYCAGGYEYSFVLHDSLNLKLDRNYSVYLAEPSKNINDYHYKDYISGNFHYEDYELSKLKISLRMPEKQHFTGVKFSVFVKGSDENDLPLMDSRVKVFAKALNISYLKNDLTFVPDTLFCFEKPLLPNGETEIVLSDSLFPKANFAYEIAFALLTSDNRRQTKSEKVKYFYFDKKLEFSLVNDSIEVIYRENQIRKQQQVSIFAYDNLGYETSVFQGTTPLKIPLNAYYKTYKAKGDNIENYFDIPSQNSMLECYAQRTKDSVFFTVQNPRNLHFTYNIYKTDTEKMRGVGVSLNYRIKERSAQNYFVSLRYVWGGKVKDEFYRIPLYDRKLNISVVQPVMAFPSQKIETEISITDARGKPVQNVDLTAFALTNKFNYQPPTLPDFSKQYPNKKVVNNFKINDFNNKRTFKETLDKQYWDNLAHLDTIEFYKFLYPKPNEIYRFEYETADKISQFAPFVVDEKGEIQPIHVIYLDSRPVYFSWSNNEQPYSFRATAGKHHIRLRLYDREIVLNDFQIPHAKKVIFSMLPNSRNEQHYWRVAKKNKFTDYEQNTQAYYIFPYRYNFPEGSIAYAQNGENIQLLSSVKNNYDDNIRLILGVKNNYHNLAGPISGIIDFKIMGGFSFNFSHEPYFEYDFAPKLLKMRSVNQNSYPKNLYAYNHSNTSNLQDNVLTINELEQRWKIYQKAQNRQMREKTLFSYPVKTENNFGTLHLMFDNNFEKTTGKHLNLLIFKLDETKFLRIYPHTQTVFPQLEEGFYRLMFLFDEERYFVQDSVFVEKNGNNYLKINVPQTLQRDSFSINIDREIAHTLQTKNNAYRDEDLTVNNIYRDYNAKFTYEGDGYTVSGIVYDKISKEPLIGVNVIIKGTTYGTITNIDGKFTLKVPYNRHILVVSYIGYISQEVNLQTTDTTAIALKQDFNTVLDEVVIIGTGVQRKKSFSGAVTTVSGDISRSLEGTMAGISVQNIAGTFGASPQIRVRGTTTIDGSSQPLYVIDGVVYEGDDIDLNNDEIQSFDVLKDASATAIYGTRTANGVIVISTKKGSFGKLAKSSNVKPEFDATFVEAAMANSSIRQNFSDYAYWQPRLTTDKNGKARFFATLPDDVTAWNTHVLAMNGKRQSGQTHGTIRSFKPIMAQLAVPRFLVAGDTAQVIGKSLNYTADTIPIKSSFEIGGKILQEKESKIADSQIDTLRLVAPTDSFHLRYTMKKSDGYFDGEEREIPVFPVGLEEAQGEFLILQNDTVFSKIFDKSRGEVYLYANGSAIDEINIEIERIINYRYFCNEQLASKLKAYLLKKQIAEYQKVEFKDNAQIEKVIDELVKRKNSAGWWGWWQNSDLHLPFSYHVLTALTEAKRQGFKVEIDLIKLGEMAVIQLDKEKNNAVKIQWLQLLKNIDAPINFHQFVDSISSKNLNFNDFLRLIDLKQQLGINVKTDTLLAYKHTTLFGGIYFDNNKEMESYYSLTDNKIQNTLLAYKVLKRENKDNALLPKIRLYFFENKSINGWRNTYETANIIETLFPDIWGEDKMLNHSVLTLSGDMNETIYTQPNTELEQKGFPFSAKFATNQAITVKKSGDEPLFFTLYQRVWNTEPQEKQNDFVIKTHFENGKTTLKAGEKTKLIATLKVKKSADYVMINIPIPAGCSYGEKPHGYYPEIHREYFKNETAIFCQRLQKGIYTFEIDLLPRFTGTYHLNPAKVELMYYPTFNANEGIKKIKIGK